jgi:hypothetical protein
MTDIGWSCQAHEFRGKIEAAMTTCHERHQVAMRAERAGRNAQF